MSDQQISEDDEDKQIRFWYTNYKGSMSRRVVTPIALYWGRTEYHSASQWLLRAYCHEKCAERVFAWEAIQMVPPATEPSKPESVLERIREFQRHLKQGVELLDVVANTLKELSEWAHKEESFWGSKEEVYRGTFFAVRSIVRTLGMLRG